MQKNQIHWLKSIPFFTIHISIIAAFFIPFHWKLVTLCIASYSLRMFGITAGYHRYFSHRSYKMGRIPQFLLAWLGSTSVQKGVLWWSAHHRHHHRYSDLPNDIHSPIQSGFWWSHLGWVLCSKYDETQWEQIQDLAKYPELRWINRYYLLPGILYAMILFIWGGWGAFIWGFAISTVLLWHGTFTINSLSHVFGCRRYATTDTSRNNLFLALITLGEGWHNNHHCYMSSTRQGFFWWEIDVSYYVLRLLSWIGIIGELRAPPLHLLHTKLLKPFPRNQKPNRQTPDAEELLERA